MPKISNIIIEMTSEIKSLSEASSKSLIISDSVFGFSYKESLITGESLVEFIINAKTITNEEAFQFSQGIHAFRVSVEKNGIEYTTGWVMFVHTDSSLFFYGNTPAVTVRGKSLSAFMQQEVKWKSFLNRTVREVISRISDLYGFVYETDDFNTRATWYQCGENDWDFIKRILSEVVTASGKKPYLICKNRTLKIKALNYTRPISRNFGLGTGDDRLENVRFECHGKDIDNKGGGNIELQAFDVLNKQYYVVTPDPSILPVFSKKLLTKTQSGKDCFATWKQEPELVKATVNGMWSEMTQKHFVFQADIMAELDLNVGDIIDIQAVDTAGNSSSFNGKYQIFELLHKFLYPDKILMTTIGGFRRTFNYGNIEAEGTLVNNTTSIDPYPKVSNYEDKCLKLLESKDL